MALALLGATAAAPGCSDNVILDPAGLPARVAAAAGSPPQPLPLRLLVAPVDDARPGAAARAAATDGDGDGGGDSGDGAAASGGTTAPVPQFEPAHLQEELTEVLAAARLFERVEQAPAPLAGEVAGTGQLGKLLEGAYAKPAPDDLLLRLKLLRYDVSYVGTETYPGRHILSLITFVTWIFPAWWIADEDFQCDLAVEVSVVAVGPERPLMGFDKKVYRVTHRLTLDQLERGLTFFGPFTRDFDDDNWRRVAAFCATPAREELATQIVRDLRAIESGSPQLGSVHAVAIGAGTFDPKRLNAGLYDAEADARAVHDLLRGVDGAPGVAPAKNVHLLAGRGATRAEILAAIRRASTRARPADLVYVYFAGFGATAGGQPVLVPADFDPERPLETGIPLAELGKALATRGAQLVVLDASFGSAGVPEVRTLALPGRFREGDPALLARAVEALKGPRRVVVLAGGVDGPAWTIARRSGTFTDTLLEEVRGAAPDAQGFVTLNAVFDRVRRDVQAASPGAPQDPLWLAASADPRDPKAPALRLARRAPARKAPEGAKPGG